MLLEAKNLKKSFKTGQVKAVDDISFSIEKGRTLGIVGESGCGKSTLAKLILRLLPFDGGKIYFKGRDISAAKEKDLKEFRKKVQIVFQEPYASLDPRMKIGKILREPFLIHGEKNSFFIKNRIKELLLSVELPVLFTEKFPHELSGGECQRVAIARAISLDPELVVCDEAVSSLDALVQVQILNLLLKLQKEKGMAYIFISHDLRVVRHMSDEIMVLREGKVCESGSGDEVFKSPKHAYTRLLVDKMSYLS